MNDQKDGEMLGETKKNHVTRGFWCCRVPSSLVVRIRFKGKGFRRHYC